jgi:Rrf2 family nitric oxide-sensitive transcriptional repressor
MKFTRHTDYALRVLMHLAAEPERLMSIHEIATAQRVSKNHLMKVVHALSLAGFVSTARGRGGGLRLARPAGEIRVGDVVRSTEGDCALVDCTGCVRAPGCRLTGVLKDALGGLYAALDDRTIGDLQPRRRD